MDAVLEILRKIDSHILFILDNSEAPEETAKEFLNDLARYITSMRMNADDYILSLK